MREWARKFRHLRAAPATCAPAGCARRARHASSPMFGRLAGRGALVLLVINVLVRGPSSMRLDRALSAPPSGRSMGAGGGVDRAQRGDTAAAASLLSPQQHWRIAAQRPPRHTGPAAAVRLPSQARCASSSCCNERSPLPALTVRSGLRSISADLRPHQLHALGQQLDTSPFAGTLTRGRCVTCSPRCAQRATGVLTGSIYNDAPLQQTGLWGEVRTLRIST